MKELAAALSKAQSELGVVPKSGYNPHFKSKFSTFQDHVDSSRSILAKNGLAISQMPNLVDGQYVLTTILMHESGESIVANQPVISVKNDPQSMMSALSYAKRYAWAGVLGQASGEVFEDDGNAATAPEKTSPKQNKAPSGAKVQGVEERINAVKSIDELKSLFDNMTARGEINEESKKLFSKRKNELAKG